MPPDTTNDGAFFYVLQDALRILFVDDDPILREFAGVHLTTENATVAVAQDGQAALEAMVELRPDIVLMDLEMPVMDGFQALARARADHRIAQTPIVVITGREDVAAIDRAFEAGATSFVAKPLNWRLLSYQIRYIDRARRREAALRAQAAQARKALEDLSIAGSRFLSQALDAAPALRTSGGPYLAAIETAARAAGGG